MMSTGDIKVTEMAIQKRMGRLKEMAKTTSGYVEFYFLLLNPPASRCTFLADSAIQFII